MHARQTSCRSILVATVALGLATMGYAQSSTEQPQSGPSANGAMGQHGRMMGGEQSPQQPGTPPCWQQQREWYQKMTQQRQEADQRLQSLVEKMNSATGSAKVDAMQAVINELVKQRQEWQRGWGGMSGYGMGPGMMGYGMGYGMHPGMGPGMGYGMGPGPGHPCRQQTPQQGAGQGPGESR